MNIINIWGIKDFLLMNNNYFIKYSNNYFTKTFIDLNTGLITITTNYSKYNIISLRKAIVKIFFVIFNLKLLTLYKQHNLIITKLLVSHSDKVIKNKKHILYKLDKLINYYLKNNIIDYHHILNFRLKLKINKFIKFFFKNILLIYKVSKKYKIDLGLLLAIIHMESDFNPYVISKTNALGLMQIIQHSAVQDVFKMKGKLEKPSKQFLLEPKNNIDIGTAYLAILQNIYFAKINNPISRSYAVITAYNSGVNSVLHVFSSHHKLAFNKINNCSPKMVFKKLSLYHPSLETRNYLLKVTFLQKYYNNLIKNLIF